MKRYMRGLVAIIIILGLLGGTAGAVAPDCSGALVITNTGSGSTNEVNCVAITDVHVSCVNNINVVTNNDQVARSGNASGTTSITGNGTNQNGAAVQIGAACGTPAATTTTPVPPNTQSTPVTPNTPSSTPVTPATGSGATKPKVAALPNTASNQAVETAAIGLATIASVLALSRLIIFAYQRTSIN